MIKVERNIQDILSRGNSKYYKNYQVLQEPGVGGGVKGLLLPFEVLIIFIILTRYNFSPLGLCVL